MVMNIYNCDDISSNSPKIAIFSDIHILGKRKSSWLRRTWNDLQIWLSYHLVKMIHQPSYIFLLGDQFDEGTGRTSEDLFQEYVKRFYYIFPKECILLNEDITSLKDCTQVPIIAIVGNHDVGFRQEMSYGTLQRAEQVFGTLNRIIELDEVTLIAINSMQFSFQSHLLETQTQAFLERSLNYTITRRRDKPLFLLSHFPLYRQDDTQCGEERLRESGHITYEHPTYKYTEEYDTISADMSSRLLQLFPTNIFSGHTHALCTYRHTIDGKTAVEYTTPSCAWSMRPDPSYALVHINNGSSTNLKFCKLIHEHYIFIAYGLVGIIEGIYLLVLVLRRRRR